MSNVPIIFCATIIFSALREYKKILLYLKNKKREKERKALLYISVTASFKYSIPLGSELQNSHISIKHSAVLRQVHPNNYIYKH